PLYSQTITGLELLGVVAMSDTSASELLAGADLIICSFEQENKKNEITSGIKAFFNRFFIIIYFKFINLEQCLLKF
ncbi:MAG: hypothetical protein ACI9NN_001551, partial [Bacteroidia bacterium]